MADDRPYLSVVVTARNDDHGGNLLGRMQAFVNGWIAQSKRHGLASELIFVEWNPPQDRPPLGGGPATGPRIWGRARFESFKFRRICIAGMPTRKPCLCIR